MTKMKLSLDDLQREVLAQVAKKKTLNASRKARTKRTANNILQVKERLSKETDSILMATAFKKFIQSTIVQHICDECGHTTQHAGDSYVINEDKQGNHYFGQRLTNRMLFDLNLTDTEVQVIYTDIHVPRCAACLQVLEALSKWRNVNVA